jgi:hypothetical protein
MTTTCLDIGQQYGFILTNSTQTKRAIPLENSLNWQEKYKEGEGEMKFTAHILIEKDYWLGLDASQWPSGLIQAAEEFNEEYHGVDWRSHPRQRAVVTVEFDVPDNIFEREAIETIKGTMKKGG